ncbi:MAG: glutamyl-tRNA reductase [Ginsengibacter sp.]
MIQLKTNPHFLNDFCVAGINYRKSDISIRSKFSLLPEQSALLLQAAVSENFPGCMVLSTCNRTEIYGICDHPQKLIEMLCIHTHGNLKDFMEQGYQYYETDAIEHLFKVAAGLDSQIIGDYEILAQLKHAVKEARENGCINNFMDRVINFAFQASKEIKTTTLLSSGTLSVSYAAIKIIKEKIADLNNKKVLLMGAGKFGHNIGKNLKDYLPDCSLFFTNRTDSKALELAEECGGQFVPYDSVPSAVNDADVIIVSTASETYTLFPSLFTNPKPHLILDLSVPKNVDPALQNIDGVSLLNVDEISMILDKTISLRKSEIPKAMSVINNTIEELMEWYHKRLNNQFQGNVMGKLCNINEAHFSNQAIRGNRRAENF